MEEETKKQGAGAKIKGLIMGILGAVKRFFVDNWKSPRKATTYPAVKWYVIPQAA